MPSLTETNELLFKPEAMKRVVKNYIEEVISSGSEVLKLDIRCKEGLTTITITMKNKENS